MSLLSALDSALTGLRATQIQVQNTSDNIANAGDKNYTRKTVSTEALPGGGAIGGVRVTGFGRTVDTVLNKAYLGTISDSSLSGTLKNAYGNVKDLFGISTDTAALTTTISDFSNAWQALSTAPEDVVRQSQVVTTGAAVANEIKRLSAGVEAMDRSIKADTGDAVARINTLLQTIQKLNVQVSGSSISGLPSGGFEDQRDAAVRELAQYVNVKQVAGENGTIRLITPAGYTLVDSGQPQSLTYDGTTMRNNHGDDVGASLNGGKLQTLLDLRADSSPASPSSAPGSELIRKLRSQLDAVTQGFVATGGTPPSFADAYNGAATNPGEQPNSFFTGTTRFDLTVNSALTDGTTAIKRVAGPAVTAALRDGTRTISATGLTTAGVSYTGFATAILTTIGQDSNAVDTNAASASATEATFQERVSNASGVNVDQELVGLTQLQNSYAASARVISIVKDMFDVLDGIVR